jgi:PleD family two-component response regulator
MRRKYLLNKMLHDKAQSAQVLREAGTAAGSAQRAPPRRLPPQLPRTMTNLEMTREPLVLIANDQEWSARSLESILSPNGFRVVRVFTGHQALDRAREHQPDIIVLDAQMPDMHGFDVCRTLRDDELVGPATPVIITTAGPSGRSQRIQAFEAGAWEFFGQPLDGDALLLKLRTFLRAKLEVDRLLMESLLDSVSGLYSRKGLAHRAREIGSDASRRHEPLACVVFGADADDAADGDSPDDAVEIDAWVGQLLRRSSRVSDAVGRIAPREYAVLAPATGAVGAARLATRLGGALEEVARAGNHVRVRAGYYAVPDFARSPVDVLELLLRATTALHDLQREGDSERIRSFESPSVNLSN